MEKTLARKKVSAPAAVRGGRPPRSAAGEVEERILDAARKVFLERGFEGASIDEIAEVARSGKPTIYARFSNKQALFAAAFARFISSKHSQLESFTPEGTTIEQRLESIGETLLQKALTSEAVGLSRLAIAEARRFPDLGSSVIGMARERGTEIIARLLSEASQTGELAGLSAFNTETILTTARYFCDFILLPLFIRALAGESLEVLHSEIRPHVVKRAGFFLAACRHLDIH